MKTEGKYDEWNYMEEEGKDIEGERWGIGMKKVIFGIVILCLVMFMCPRTRSPEKKGEFSKKDK
jgi:hypothetical protein